MSKQTAVEWLVEKYELVGVLTLPMIERAKEMERKQIVKAWEYGCMTNYGDAQTYYNETYKGGEQ